jgi:hypothetical protein
MRLIKESDKESIYCEFNRSVVVFVLVEDLQKSHDFLLIDTHQFVESGIVIF